MKKCNKCDITYNTNRYTCPFCKNLLTDQKDESIETIYQPYPKFKDKIKKTNLIQKILVFLSIIAIIIVITANYYEYKEETKSLWSIITLLGIVTIWSLIKGLIISKKNIAKRIINFGFCLILLILSIEYLSITSQGNYSNWSINYVIPFILMGILTTINLLMLIRRKKFSDYMGYQFWLSIILILYRLLYTLNITSVIWPSLAALIYGISSIIALFFFGGKNTKEEFKKRLTI